MIVSIHQPLYLPWSVHFERIARSDVHVVLDTVPWGSRRGLINRNRVRAPGGGWCWLTVPVHAGMWTRVCDVEIDNSRDWGRKQFRTLEQSYGRSPEFDAEGWRNMLTMRHDRLEQLNTMMLCWVLWKLEIEIDLRWSSSIEPHGVKSELILDLCRKVGGDVYLSGPKGRDYLDLEAFERAGIEVRFDEFRPHDDEFVDGKPLSVIDSIFRETACVPSS